jgi:LacI family transcriptional regulator
MPIVALDRPLEGSKCDRLLVQNKQGAQAGVRHLIQLGHKHIAFFGLARPIYSLRMRQQGYEAAMTAAGLRPSISPVTDAPEDTLAALRKTLASSTPPTALFGSNNLVTRHLLHSMLALGLHAPDSLALVGFDDFETADLMRPGITVVRQPVESLGRMAAQILFSRLVKGGKQTAPRRMMLPVELVIRGSCGAKL